MGGSQLRVTDLEMDKFTALDILTSLESRDGDDLSSIMKRCDMQISNVRCCVNGWFTMEGRKMRHVMESIVRHVLARHSALITRGDRPFQRSSMTLLEAFYFISSFAVG